MIDFIEILVQHACQPENQQRERVMEYFAQQPVAEFPADAEYFRRQRKQDGG